MANETDKLDPDFLKLEYQECVSASRFVVGTRFNYFVSFTTFFFILVGGFHYAWTTNVFGELKPQIMLVIALFGIYIVVIALILEWRAAQLYRAADNRAAELEKLMGIKDGIRQIFVMPERRKKLFFIPLTHTASIRMFYMVIGLIWISLALFSVYHILV